MAEHTPLRQNAIVRNATVGASPPHGPVKTGELPNVHVKQPPGGPQVQEGQQKPVTILPPSSAESAVRTGGLPMVKVKMTDGRPKPDDGVDEKVVIRDSKHGAVSAGALPMVQVKMENGRPQIQTAPNVAAGPPQIPAAAPALSAPRAAPLPARQGYVAKGPLPVQNQFQVSRVAAPRAVAAYQPTVAAQPQVALPPIPEMSPDQLLLCRHAIDKFLAEIRSSEPAPPAEVADAAEGAADTAQVSESTLATIQLAEATLATLDDILVATAVHAEAAAIAAAAPPVQAVPTTARTASATIASAPAVSAAASQSIAPSPSVSYAAGRVAGPYVAAGSRAQRNAAMAPRRVARPQAAPRPAGPLPMVEVKMDGQRAVVQNQAEVEAAKAAMAAAEAAPAVDSSPDGTGDSQG